MDVCRVEILGFYTVRDELSKLLANATADIKKLLARLEPLENFRVDGGLGESEIEEAVVADAWVREYPPSSVSLVRVSRDKAKMAMDEPLVGCVS